MKKALCTGCGSAINAMQENLVCDDIYLCRKCENNVVIDRGYLCFDKFW